MLTQKFPTRKFEIVIYSLVLGVRLALGSSVGVRDTVRVRLGVRASLAYVVSCVQAINSVFRTITLCTMARASLTIWVKKFCNSAPVFFC